MYPHALTMELLIIFQATQETCSRYKFMAYSEENCSLRNRQLCKYMVGDKLLQGTC